MARRLTRAFYRRDTATVARELLGCTLVSRIGGTRVEGTLVELEAYVRGDSTAHSFRGMTARNAPMFHHPGTAYVYFTYGMHFCMNLVTEPEGVPTAVLLRAVMPTVGIEVMRTRRGARASDGDLCRGPARLCVAFGIDRAVNGTDSCAPEADVWVERGARVVAAAVATGPRIGVVGTAEDIARPLRFWIAGHRGVSHLRRTDVKPGVRS